MITEASQVEAVLSLMANDWELKRMYEHLVQQLEIAGHYPESPAPTDRDWLGIRVDAGEGESRTLATMLLRLRDSQTSCPEWVRKIKSYSR